MTTTTLNSTASTSLLVEQIFHTATCEASLSMSRWTGGAISLELNEIRQLPLEEVVSEFGLGEQSLAMVVLTLDGTLGGSMILTFDEANGRQLAAALLRRPLRQEAVWSELERSALCETGNILACAYLGALTKYVGANLVPSPPCFVNDYASSVLEQALMSQAVTCDVVTIGRTVFQREGERLNWNVFFIPSPELGEALAIPSVATA